MNSAEMSPIFLSPGNRLVTVFGGGAVALRKCRHFSGFRIRVISEEVLPELDRIAEEVHLRTIDVDKIDEFLKDSDIVVAATNSKELNDSIRDRSMQMGIMTNSAHGGGDVLIPSTLHRDGWTVCVSSEGNAPAFPPYVIERIDECLDGSYDSMLELLSILRGDIRERIPTQPERAAFMAMVVRNEDIWGMLRDDRVEEARAEALRKGGIQ